MLISRQQYHNNQYKAIRDRANTRLKEAIADMEEEQEAWCGDITNELDQLSVS